MSKIDSIGPETPSFKKFNKPSDFKIKKEDIEDSVERKKKSKRSEASKKRLMFFLIFLIMIVVIIGWLFLLKEGLIFSSRKGDNDWSKIKEGFGSILDTFKGDIFPKKQEDLNKNYASEKEKIKDLEERLFPEFNNANKNTNKTE